MYLPIRKLTLNLVFLFFTVLVHIGFGTVWGSDHADTPELISIGRHEARLTDLFSFQHGDNLVLALCTNPAIPKSVSEYIFPSDLTLRIHIDNHSKVSFENPDDNSVYGGTIVRPNHVSEDITFKITFNKGKPQLCVKGLQNSVRKDILLFAGLRDDPFIRTPTFGKNVAAVVMEIPMSAVMGSQPTLLIWATSKIPDIKGPISDHDGRALRSQFENQLNTEKPRYQGLHPDVIIYDISRPAAFPNGRKLEDDVVHLVPNPIIDSATQNDVPFLIDFPYLAPPHPPTP
ncbi:MAG: hypothetical protein U0586_10475 [Candidatus Brocadiaceae bacterium]